MAGILRYGTYVPYCRLQRSALSGGGRGERSVAGHDEDSTSLAVEAAREALRGTAVAPSELLFASTSHPYAEKLNAATIHAAAGLPAATRSMDIGGSTRAGLAALGLAPPAGNSGPRLVCAADIVIGAPMGPRESAGGDAACAFVLGQGAQAGAEIAGASSRTEELLDVWRGPEQQFARQWEERFAHQRLLPALESALDDALRQAGMRVSDIDRLAVDTGHPRIAAALAESAGLRATQAADNLAASVGRCGAAHAGLLLASLLDTASPGERIAVLCAADGAEALIVEVTSAIENARPSHRVSDWIASKRSDLSYETYLKWRGILPFEPPRRPDPPRPAAPPMQRSERWKYAFAGGRCRMCGTVTLPPQRVCPHCAAVDAMDEVPCADATARVATCTVDHLAYSLQQPVIAAVMDFDQGGRFACELTDMDADTVEIGQALEMTFRRLYTSDGVRNYFWKARPRR